MESNRYSSSTTVKDKDGNSYKVNNQLLATDYPSNRPMVFSEAQQYAFGLELMDLSQVERKLVQINKKVAEKWTLHLNYINLPGVTKEAIYRQMALEALLEFNREFDSGNLFNASTAMYPMTVDLRAISFDI